MYNQVDLLQKALMQRLASHVLSRCPSLDSNKEWPFHFAAENMARLAAIMVFQGYVKDDISCLGAGKTLLKQGGADFHHALTTRCKSREGAYLYYDTNDGVFIRSGKVSGRGFLARHLEHKKAAREGVSSNFYRRYPSKELVHTIPNTTNRCCRGFFENLTMYVGLSINPRQRGIDDLLSSIFLFSCDVLERIKKLKFGVRGDTSLPQEMKKRHMFGYLAELAYDLCICSSDNISNSPGFEACGLWVRNN